MKQNTMLLLAGAGALAFVLWPRAAVVVLPRMPLTLAPSSTGYKLTLEPGASWLSVTGNPAQGSSPLSFGSGASPAGVYVWKDASGATQTTIITYGSVMSSILGGT